ERLKKGLDSFFGAVDLVIDDAELIWIGPAVALDGESLAAPNELAAAFAKMLPTADCVFTRPAVGRAVPAFHRMNAPAVADAESADIERLRQRTALGRRQNTLIRRRRRAKLSKPGFQRRNTFEMSNLWKILHAKSRSPDILSALGATQCMAHSATV